MRFYNMDKIADNINIHNKYLLTSIIAQRARQISETKGRAFEKGSDEKYISLALADMEAGHVKVSLPKDAIPDAIENEVNLTERENASAEESPEAEISADEPAESETPEAEA
ncbi:MAG: DNA-directed RNA polymerase subunit omega [Pyramidobacter sp.]|nr:DNA-directed RNA polymerase subunit omega [Pyramidobacter sp.]